MRMVRATGKPWRRAASCWSLLVVKGGAGFFFFSFARTSTTRQPTFDPVAGRIVAPSAMRLGRERSSTPRSRRIARASSSLWMSSFGARSLPSSFEPLSASRGFEPLPRLGFSGQPLPASEQLGFERSVRRRPGPPRAALLLRVRTARIDRYSSVLNAWISCSRSTMIRRATDWTRPAESQRRTAVPEQGLSL